MNYLYKLSGRVLMFIGWLFICSALLLLIQSNTLRNFGAVDQVRILPDPILTPGAINPNVSQANIATTVCAPNWTSTIRPPVSYTNKLKIQQIKQYGYTDTTPANYEEDHLISLVLGGSPTDPANLWPQSYKTVPNARNKDAVEMYLRHKVCSGSMTLIEAQTAIRTDWTVVYKEMISKLGSVESQDVIDSDDN